MSETESNRKLVGDAFAAWAEGDGNAFFRLLADDVRWTVIGATAISGAFTSRQEFQEKAARRIGAVLARPLVPRVVSLLADGDSVAVQWEADAETKSGTPYRQTYSWVLRLRDGQVVEGTAYLDTELITTVLKEEPGESSATDPTRRSG